VIRQLGLALVLSTAFGGRALAQPATSAPAAVRESLRDRTGASSADKALREGDSRARERAVTRLGALGTPRALELLMKALEGNGLAQSARERLLAVRALATHAREPRVRDCLTRITTSISATAERADPLLAIVRDTAALALARSGDAAALTALARGLRQPGRVAEAARTALVAHPPPDLSLLVRAHGAPTLELVHVLEELNDQRSFDTLRDMVQRGSSELRARAAIALVRQGSFESVELARRWGDGPNRSLALAAAEILTLARAPDATPLVVDLLGHPETRAQALVLSRRLSGTGIERALADELSRADPSELGSIVGALSHAAGPLATQALEKLARGSDSSALAFQALSLAVGDPARGALDRLLDDPATRRGAARAGVLRSIALGDPPRELGSTLEQLLDSKSAADRAVGAFGVARLEPARARELVSSTDPQIAEGAARAAPFVGAASVAAARLAREPRGRLRTQLALSLVDRHARALVSTRLLVELIDEQSLASPIALFALAERDSEETRARLLEHLASPDPLWRAQVALGLGSSDDPSALGVLENAYRFEVETNVRYAIVHAIARRSEGAKRRTLELAATLDPDPATRTLARLGLFGASAPTWSPGHATFGAALERSDGAARGAIVTPPGGLALPLLADPDGALALAGLAAGPIQVRVALLPAEGKSPGRGSP
jgi:HEAT repeat protein